MINASSPMLGLNDAAPTFACNANGYLFLGLPHLNRINENARHDLAAGLHALSCQVTAQAAVTVATSVRSAAVFSPDPVTPTPFLKGHH